MDEREPRTGTLLGIPYDLRRPTVARFKERWWNDDDRRLVVPRVFGWGYDLNLAELGRRLGLRAGAASGAAAPAEDLIPSDGARAARNAPSSRDSDGSDDAASSSG